MAHLEFTRANTTGVIRGGRLRIVQMPSARAANPGQSANSIPGMLHEWIGKQQEPVRPQSVASGRESEDVSRRGRGSFKQVPFHSRVASFPYSPGIAFAPLFTNL